MATERRHKSASEVLNTLHALSLDTEEEILAMSHGQVRARLIEDGINPHAKNAELASRLKTIRGQQRLAEARERRSAQESAKSNCPPAYGLAIDRIRSEVEKRLGLLFPAKTQAVQAYFNRFKEADDDDLPGLLDDLERLDEQSEESE